MTPYARAAFLPDTFHEVNGVAHTSRQLVAFARRRQFSFLTVHCGPGDEAEDDGAVRMVQLRRGWARIGLDANLDYDPFLMRYAKRVMGEIQRFSPDLIHITGPGDMGAMGCYIAWRLKIPLVISWHTSLHEYAGRRLERLLGFAGKRMSERLGASAENLSLQILGWFYRKAKIVLAPNRELVDLTRSLTSRPAYLMRRGVDTHLFSPARRNRISSAFRIGYVGRLTPEKSVRFLAELSRTLVVLGRDNFEFMIIGEGSEEHWLRKHVPGAIFTGVLRGERLAEGYAGMDLFVFPSTTDTFGNVILEALASGVPAVVTNSGGPKFLVQSGVTGHVASSDWDFISFVNQIMTDTALHRQMREAARQYALAQSWDAVFEDVFRAYADCLQVSGACAKGAEPLLSSRVHGRGGS